MNEHRIEERVRINSTGGTRAVVFALERKITLTDMLRDE
jgi:hypothetical protein